MSTNLPMVEEIPALDLRPVPRSIRHATVIGALSAIRPGRSLDLVAPHDPQPLLRQVEGLEPDTWSVEYLQQGPDAWTLRLTRAQS
ncbi:DUF2249 domain-containing protein [Janibacter cremeus]|uniref:Uncharacterized protein (DUF2249 family) n=1 Tax=Janibacter cremeus TaxID=1285192 RepID=A0A852VN23_9MICO|nr:DUF2249 domain-containing protein [Janibacter cremeus]NYF98457.1 uncharacterized protein (DUF2249 family) [Janibacter cremeus]